METLQSIPQSLFETVGIFAGLFGCTVIGIQVVKEYQTPYRSSLSFAFLFGWLLIYMFWAIYGLRFNALALLIPNTIATLLQIGMIAIVIKKRKKYSA